MMFNINDYFDSGVLRDCWGYSKELSVEFKKSYDNPFDFYATENLRKKMEDAFKRGDGVVVGGQIAAKKAVGEYLKQGPVIIQPTLELIELMGKTEIKVKVSEYRQKHPIIGIEIQGEKSKEKFFVLVWNPIPGWIMIFGTSAISSKKHKMVERIIVGRNGDDLIESELKPIDSDYNYLNEDETPIVDDVIHSSRIAMNLALLMTHRPFDLTPLPPKIAKNREGNNDRLRQLAAREAQAVIFRDLIIKPKPKYIECQETGVKLKPQLRCGHWKNQPHGADRKERKLIWIEPYWTGQPNDDDLKPTIIYR